MTTMTKISGACAGLAMLAAMASPAGAAVTVYDATQVSYSRYTILERLWVDSWITAVNMPDASTREAAVQGLVHKAERISADGLVNVHCLRQRGWTGGAGNYFCYGDAIKLKKTP
jgi:hypothetical protein